LRLNSKIRSGNKEEVHARRAISPRIFLRRSFMNSRIILGLGFGDECKGSEVDSLCREYGATLVVRYDGGPQAGHRVVLQNGKQHTFRQIGSGAFIRGVKTLLSRFMLFDPITLGYEVRELSKETGSYVLGNHYVDCRAPIITPYHAASNRIKEFLRGNARHGSCGKGIGETAYDLVHFPEEVIRTGDLENETRTSLLLEAIRERKCEELLSLGADFSGLPKHLHSSARLFLTKSVSETTNAYAKISQELNIIIPEEACALIRENNSVFEGAQGVLLDEWHGFHPHTTWSTTTQKNALELLRESGFKGEIETIGVTRTYGTRHSNGPFVTEDKAMWKANPAEENRRSIWQGKFREGYLDLVALRYAVECVRACGKLDAIALTHLDVFKRKEKVFYCDGYQLANGEKISRLVPQFEHDLVYQEKLTNMLFTARPIYAGVTTTGDEAVNVIQEALSAPIKYRSYGPTECDKIII